MTRDRRVIRTEDERQRIAQQVDALKQRATPDAIRRMQAVLDAEVARRAAKQQPAAAAKPQQPSQQPSPGGSHAMEVLRRWLKAR